MLKFKYEEKQDIPAGAETFYVESDGMFVLQAEGVKSEDDVAGLEKALNSERKIRRDAEAQIKEYKSKYSLLPDDFNIDEYNKLKDSANGDLEVKLKEQSERISSQYKKLLSERDAELEQSRGLVRKHVVEATLRKEMAQNNIGSAYMPAVEAMMRDKIKLEGENVLLDDLPISEGLKLWASSDEGKHYVTVAPSSGGGADNKTSNNSGKKISREQLDGMSQRERSSFFSSGGQVTD